jgi:large subunit ribosomal protein L22
MQFSAKAKYIRCSPGKLRLLTSSIRGKNVDYVLNILRTLPIKKALPVTKLVASAAANAKSLKNIEAADLVIKEIRVDRGPIFRYYKPGAMGRTAVQRRRVSHITVMLESVENKKD